MSPTPKVQKRPFILEVEFGKNAENGLGKRFLEEVGLSGLCMCGMTSHNGPIVLGPARAELVVTGITTKKNNRGTTFVVTAQVSYWRADQPVAWTERYSLWLTDRYGEPLELEEGWRKRFEPFRRKSVKYAPWEVGPSGEPKPRLTARALAISPDGSRAIVLDEHEQHSIATVLTLPEGTTIQKKTFRQRSARVVAAGGPLLVAPSTKSTWVYDTEQERHWSLKAGKHDIQIVRVSPDGRRIATGSGSNWMPFDFAVRVWSRDRLEHKLTGHEAIVIGLGFVGQDRLVSVDLNFEACVWDLESGSEIVKMRMPGRSRPPTAGNVHSGVRAWVLGGRVLATHGGELKLWRLGADELEASCELRGEIDLSANGNFALVHPVDGPIQVLADLNAGQLLEHQSIDVPPESTSAFGPEGSVFVYNSDRLERHELRPLDSPRSLCSLGG